MMARSADFSTLFTLLSCAISQLACDASAPAPACQTDRDCQDGDLCNGPEFCRVGQCTRGLAPSPPPRACDTPSSGCDDLCASEERCAAGRCLEVCLPPFSPILPHLPVGSTLSFPEGARAAFVPADLASNLPSTRTLTLTGVGHFSIEARWESPEPGCETAIFRAQVEALETAPFDPLTAPDAIAMDDPRLTHWASGFGPPSWGTELSPEWQDPTRAIGEATGLWDDATSLGNGGHFTVVFETPISDRDGPDLAVFENGFSELFLELAWVEVSSNGRDFARFASFSSQAREVGAYGTLDPREVMGVAGRFEAGFGTSFDLETLSQTEAVLTGRVDLSAITHVRVVDIIGDGSNLDSQGHPIFDPSPTYASAGFDLEAVGAIDAGRN